MSYVYEFYPVEEYSNESRYPLRYIGLDTENEFVCLIRFENEILMVTRRTL